MSSIVFKQPSDLRGLNRTVHDMAIDIDGIVFEAARRRLSIPTELLADDFNTRWSWIPFRRATIPVRPARLMIANVVKWSVTGAIVEPQTIEEIRYDSTLIAIETDLGTRVQVEVDALHIELEPQGEPIATKLQCMLFTRNLPRHGA